MKNHVLAVEARRAGVCDVTAPLSCYRCGESLAELSLPLARRDECPKCRVELHVCRMCVHYAPRLSRGCNEDDAPDVRNKETANFCDYYKPSANAFDTGRASSESAARAELAKLFGEPGLGEEGPSEAAHDAPSKPEQTSGDPRSEAEALFKR